MTHGSSDYPDPTLDMLNGNPLFDAIWYAIKDWDISRGYSRLYSGATGSDARHIYDAIKQSTEVRCQVCGCEIVTVARPAGD